MFAKSRLSPLRVFTLLALSFCLVACGSQGTGTPAASDSGDSSVDVSVVGNVDGNIGPEGGDAASTEDTPVENQTVELRVDSIDPAKGMTLGGETVTIYGEGFQPGTAVMFDGSAGLFTFVLGPDRINVTTPPHPPGLANVTIILPDERIVVLENGFLYYNNVSITEVNPAQGPAAGGSPITVKGSGFSADTKLLVGDSLAINTEVVDDGTILALTPGGEPGPVDVFVSNESGIGKLKDGYLFTDAPRIDTIVPTAGPVAGGQTVTFTGAGFVEPLEVRFGMEISTQLNIHSAKIMEVTTPPGTEGMVDIWVSTEFGTTVIPNGYNYYSAPPTGVQVLNVVPHEGPILGGTKVVVTASGLGTSLETSVRFGDVTAELLEIDPVAQSAIVLTPPNSEGMVDVTVYSPIGTGAMADAFNYTSTLAVAEIEPNYGPVEGGSEITVIGMGFESTSEVFIDALPALGVEFISPTELRATTPPGTPGFATVKVAQGLKSASLNDGFFYMTGGTDIYVVTPEKGSIAGGTFIDILGIGFEDGAQVMVGGFPATHVTFIDPTHVTARTPPGEIGTVDVEVISSVGTAKLSNGYTFYDPVSLYGGTWGEPVEISVNVTVLNGSAGGPVPDAFVILGSDPTTAFQGFTNPNGQITFSGPDLAGPQTISVSKAGFENNSVVAFDAENVTIYLTPSAMGMGSGPMITPPIVKGQVFGLGKYIVGQPGACFMGQGTDPKHCLPCDNEDECGDLGAKCMDLGNQGQRCVQACTTDLDCPSSNACKPFGSDAYCIPTPGTKVAVCQGTKPHIFAKDLNPGTGAVVNELGTYSIVAYPGEVAIVCLGGFVDLPEPVNPTDVMTNLVSSFTPVAMGVYRHLNLVPEQIAEDINVTLDIPLSRTLKLRLEDPPLDVADFLYAMIYYDFGSDGVFRSPVAPFSWSDDTLFVEGQPAGFADDIEDASYTIMAGAFSATEDNTPLSVVLRTNLKEPEDDRMLRMIDGAWELSETGVNRNILGVYGTETNHVFAVGTDGTIYHYNGNNHSIQPSDTKKTLRAIDGSANNDIWVSGDDGKVMHFDGIAWSSEDVDTAQDLRAIYAAGGGEVFVAGNYTIKKRSAEGVWQTTPGPSGSWWGLDGLASDDVWLVGTIGKIYHYNGSAWLKKNAPTVKNLRATEAISADDVWFVGEGGTILHWDGENVLPFESGTERTLTGIHAKSSNDIYAVGARGTVLHYDGVAWSLVDVPNYSQNMNDVLTFADSSRVYTFGDHELFLGPMVQIPVMDEPQENGTLTQDYLDWHFSDGTDPHFQYLKIAIPSMLGDIPVWTFIGEGTIDAISLPDFQNIEGTPGIPEGTLKMTMYRVYKEGFDIDHFDYSDLNTMDWGAWAFDTFLFTKVAQ
jgi:hypothetical protein